MFLNFKSSKKSKIATTFAFTLLFAFTYTYTSSFEDCQAFASKFDNTCNANGIDNGVEVKCANVLSCAGTFEGDTCVFIRKLCVTCIDKNGTTYINVNGNSLPNHCPGGPNAPFENLINFEVKWNWDVQDKLYTSAFSQKEFDTLLCDIDWPIDFGVPSQADYSLLSDGQTDTMTGVALSGGFIYSAVSQEQTDVFFPDYYANVTDIKRATERVDTCMIHGDSEMHNHLHYHILSPCILEPEKYNNKTEPCHPGTECGKDMKEWILKGYENYKHLNPIGLAKDGHIIWGPYKDDGTIWNDCDVDMCNGAMIDGSYGYVSSTFFPYFLGCWGPGSNTSITESCTTNGRKCSSKAPTYGLWRPEEIGRSSRIFKLFDGTSMMYYTSIPLLAAMFSQFF